MKKYSLTPKIALILAPVILFSYIILTGKALFWGTPSTQFIPWWSFAWRSLLAGQLPLWNPWVGMGAPLVANYQSGLFYPPYWIYFLVYAAGGVDWMAWSVTLIVCVHLIWAGWGTARLLEELRVGELGQAVGGLAFSLSGYLVARAGFLSINAAASWLPWLLLGVLKVARDKKNPFLTLTGPIAMMLLAGHAQTAWYSLVLGGVWMIFWSITSLPDTDGRWKTLGAGLLKYAAAGILGAGICAIQLLPTLEYLIHSPRAGEYGYSLAVTYSFWPWRILTLFVPNLFGTPVSGNYWGYGNFWEDAIYIGLFPIALALGALIQSLFLGRRPATVQNGHDRRAVSIFLGSITVVSFVLALGDNTPLFPFLYRFVPTFDLFQAPTRWTIWAVLSLSLLAGIGMDSLEKPSGRGLYFTRLAAAGCLAVVAGSALAWYFIKEIKPTFFLSTALAGVIGFLSVLLVLGKPADRESQQYRSWAWLVILLIGADMIGAGWGLNPGIEKSVYRETSNGKAGEGSRVWIPPDDEYQLKYKKYFLFSSFSPLDDWSSMFDLPLPNQGMLNRVEMVNNFDPLVPEYYQYWMDELVEENTPAGALDLMAVGEIIQLSGDSLLFQERDLPEGSRLRVVGCKEVLDTQEDVLEKVIAAPGDYFGDIVLTSRTEVNCVPGASGAASVMLRKNGYLQADVTSDKPGWLFWSQSLYPGWLARIDGKRIADPIPGNYLFQAVAVPAGTHQVEFIYRPASVIWGGAVTLLSLALWAFLVGIKRRTS